MLKKLSAAALLALALTACSKPPTPEQAREGISKVIPLKFDLLQITAVQDLPLYEVVISVEGEPVVVYVDRNVRHVFSGNLFSVEPVVNLTVEARNKYLKK